MFNSTTCVICRYSITDPICRGCYIKQTIILLKDNNVNPLTIDFINEKLKKGLYLETQNDNNCILCKKDNITICRYCFSVILIRMLRELNFTEEMIENFEYNPLPEEEYIHNEIINDYEFGDEMGDD